MICNIPLWATVLFSWKDYELITQDILNNAMNWMLSKGLIICNELV